METNTGNPVVPQPTAPVDPAPVAPTPAPVSDRTADQFAKLLESNKRLAEQNEVYRKSIDLLNTPAPVKVQAPTASVAPTKQNASDFIETDPNTGERFINEAALASRLAELEQRASKADQVESQLNTFVKTQNETQMQRETNEAIQAFPELDPKAQNFDPEFLRDVRARITDSMINPTDYSLPAGQRLEYKRAAELVKAQYSRYGVQTTQKVTEQQEAEAQQAAAEAKAQATAQVPNTSAPAQVYSTQADAELSSLRMKTRLGSDEALAKRLLHTEHIVPKDGSGGSSA